jgi:hypothetical protein
MDDLTSNVENAADTITTIVDSLLHYLPNLLGAIALIVIGWLLARLTRRAVVAMGHRMAQVLSRLFAGTQVENLRVSDRMTATIGSVFFAIVLLVFIAAAARVAQIPAFATWLDQIVAYLPQLVAGLVIIVGGILVGIIVRDLSAAGLDAAGIARSRTISYFFQVTIVAITVVMALNQVGIDATLLIILLSVVAGSAAFGIALAFGLGARQHVENLIAAQTLRQNFRTGQMVEVDSRIGRIVELTSTGAAIQTDRGRVLVPASLFDRQSSTLLPESEGHG